MTLNTMQRNFVFSHLRRPENDLAISNIVKQITLEANKSGFNINPEYAEQTALLMNLGETHPDISYIYDPDFSWKEHPEAKDLNSKHGEYSIKMAQEEGINPQIINVVSNSYGKNRFNPQQLPNNSELEQ